MRYRVPSYFDTFKCIGSSCEDTCCAGWYIAIDEATYKKYKKVKDPVMKKRLDKELVAKKGAVTSEHVAKIKLKNNRCAFLSSEGLCDLYTHLGEGYLSQTCQLYPRTFIQVNDVLECSLALSCPEAARKILLNPEGITFTEKEGPDKEVVISASLKSNPQKPKGHGDYLLEMRNLFISILQEKEASFESRFARLERCMIELDLLAKKGQFKKIPEYITSAASKSHKEQARLIMTQKQVARYERLLENLKEIRSGKKWPSSSYEAFYEKLLAGVEASGINKVSLQKGYDKYEASFLIPYGYMLENYFVNYMYERAVPLDGEDIQQSLAYLKVYKELIELHLIGYLLSGEQLNKEQVVTFLQAFTKVFDHNPLYRKQLIKAVEKH